MNTKRGKLLRFLLGPHYSKLLIKHHDSVSLERKIVIPFDNHMIKQLTFHSAVIYGQGTVYPKNVSLFNRIFFLFGRALYDTDFELSDVHAILSPLGAEDGDCEIEWTTPTTMRSERR